MFKRLVAVILVLTIAFVAGVVIISARASALVVQQETPVPVSEFSIGNSSPPLSSSQFGPPQFNSNGFGNVVANPPQTSSGFNRPAAIKFEMTQLLRATYLLPADAAESLTKLFAHKATTLVECQTKEGDDRTTGLVKFVVTAEPATQQSIKEFIAAIFPEANVKKYLSENDSKKSAKNSGGELSENLKLVPVKLPGI